MKLQVPKEEKKSFLKKLPLSMGWSFFDAFPYNLGVIAVLLGMAVFSLFTIFKPQKGEIKETKPDTKVVKKLETKTESEGISMRDLQLEDTKQKRELEIESLEDQLNRLKEEEIKNNQELETLRK